MDRALSDGTPDLILHNAAVLTMDTRQPVADVVAIKDGRIQAVGDKDALVALKASGAKVIDCEGKTVIPGFNDAHCHPLSFAMSLLSADCSPKSVASISEIQDRIRDQAAQTAEGKWVRASGYDEFSLRENRSPNRQELDEASPSHPVVLVHATGQHCVLNSEAMRRAGITKDSPDLPGGKIQRDPETGELTGVIFGRDERIAKALPRLGPEELEQGVRRADQVYLSLGITSLQDTSWTNGLPHWQQWRRLVERGLVSPRVSMLVGSESIENFRSAGMSTGFGDRRLRVGGVKLALDESTGNPHPPQEDIDRVALRACEAGFDIAFHAGDVYMLEASLSAIDSVRRSFPQGIQTLRLEHCSIFPPELAQKAKEREAMVVTQPSFLYSMGDRYAGDLSPRQFDWLWPLANLDKVGLRLALGSDSPLVENDPLTGIRAAITRRTETGRLLGAGQRIGLRDALRMYTLGGAYASGEGEAKGSISPGKLADLLILDLGDGGEEIEPARVLKTIIDGQIVWEAS